MLYDIIVVGSGPSGSTAAAILAQKGLSVLLLDQESFPRDKPCGDLIGPTAFRVMDQVGVDSSLLSRYYLLDQARVFTPNNRSITLDYRPYHAQGGFGAVPRTQLDEVLHNHAVACGAEFRQMRVQNLLMDASRVVGVAAGHNGKVEELRSRLVIGADGASSAVARQLQPGGTQNTHRAVAIRAYVGTQPVRDVQRTAEIFYSEEVLPGYAWAFSVSPDTANIGVGMRLDQYQTQSISLRVLLERILSSPQVRMRWKPGPVTQVKSWAINFGSYPGKRAFDGALLVGDAGSFVDPVTGAGIHMAMQTAVIAAQTATQAFAKGDTSLQQLEQFDHWWRREFEKDMRIRTSFQRMLFSVPHLVNFLPRVPGLSTRLFAAFLSKM